MLEVHVFLSFADVTEINVFEIEMMMMMMMSRRSEGSREPLWYDWIFFFFVSGEFWQNRAVCLKQHCILAPTDAFVFKGKVHQF